MKTKTKSLVAYCDRIGHILYGRRLPQGMFLLARGPARRIRQAIAPIARLSYPSKPGAGDEVQLVPGIPEAGNLDSALDAYARFIVEIKRRLQPPRNNQ